MHTEERYSELAEQAGSFVHEIKNHLSTLGLNLQLLAEEFDDAQTQREKRARDRIGRLQTECQRLVDVSNDFLRFARVHELEVAPVRLSDLVGEMVDFFEPTARQANIDIKCYVSPDLPAVPIDRELVKQALLNLMLNAEQAMPTGGEMIFLAHAGPRSVCLSLIDTGQGMSAEVVSKLFRPFFTTRSNGNGLGLATSRKIVEAHGGKLEVQSEPGRGTKFSLWLPVSEPVASL